MSECSIKEISDTLYVELKCKFDNKYVKLVLNNISDEQNDYGIQFYFYNKEDCKDFYKTKYYKFSIGNWNLIPIKYRKVVCKMVEEIK